MKTSIATAVSIAGVLVAGGAAYAVNSHVMDPAVPLAGVATPATFAPAAGGIGATETTSPSGAVSENGSGDLDLAPAAGGASGATRTPAASAPAAATPPGSAPATSSPGLAPAAAASMIPAPTESLSTTFKVGTSGTVIASAVAGVVTIDSVSPAKGWSATRPRAVANGVEVDFISGSTRVDFVVQLLDGKLTGSVNSRTVDDDDRWDNPRHDDDREDDHDDREDDHEDDHEDDD